MSRVLIIFLFSIFLLPSVALCQSTSKLPADYRCDGPEDGVVICSYPVPSKFPKSPEECLGEVPSQCFGTKLCPYECEREIKVKYVVNIRNKCNLFLECEGSWNNVSSSDSRSAIDDGPQY
ncbi:MAG: hypothetical protein KDD62_10265 [Bdellovibrionales bacterium]|nr:hypothetical protein [Bdellovibrionales bacterium]